MNLIKTDVDFGDLNKRIISGVALAILALVVLSIGGLLAIIGIAVVTGLMIWEYRRVVGAPVKPQSYGFLASLAATTLAIVGAHFYNPFASVGALLIGAAAVYRLEPEWARKSLPGLFYIGLSMSVLAYMRSHFGLGAVLWIILVVIASDVGGYFAGRMVGGPKLWPAVSPNKTWSGILGGWALAFVVGVIFWLGGWTGLDYVVPLSIGVAMASQAGDLFESSFKRYFGIKDVSNLIPGHGGFMDRLDALMGALLFFAVTLIG
jgi:phosphatidate cytidylyltransferase